MNFLTHILAIWILTLSLVPCGDSYCDTVDYQEHISCVVDNHTQGDNHHSDHCSPLCFCSCCNTTVTAEFDFEFLAAVNWFDFNGFEKVEYKLPIVTPIYYPIWEPPQLLS